MQRVSRLKYIILATIACVILFCIAAFSVSMALWEGSDNTTAEVSGESGLFYVEFPYSSSLSKDTYYLEVQESSTQSRYYPMDKQSGGNEEYTITVKLKKNDKIAICSGGASGAKTVQTIENKNALTCYTLSGDTAIINETGIYALYYMVKDNEYESNKRDNNLYAEIKQEGSASFNPDVVIKCKDGDINLKISVERLSNVAPGHTELYGNDFYMYVYVNGADPDVVLSDGWPGTPIQDWDYNKKTINPIDAAYYNANELAFVFGNGINTAKTEDLSISAVGNYNAEFTFRYKTSNEDTGGDKYNVSGLDAPVVSTPYKYSEPDYIVASNTGTAVDNTTDVRSVNASVTANEQNKYIYKNYICVSRINEDGAGDNSMAFLEFAVSNSTVNPYDVRVLSINLTRRDTNDDGTPKNGTIDPAPRIYNYDYGNNSDMRLGPDPSHEKPDINGTRNPIFAHGNKHDVSEGLDGEASDNHMQDHYDDGTYVVLFFGDKKQQYFALDIEIELDRAVDFKLTVSASNINHWQRYEAGYGKPWSMYLGGLINDVWSWDPRRTTEMTSNTDPITGVDDVTSIKQEGVDVYYPSGEIDYSITLNLTAGSLVKPYLLDETGERRQDGSSEDCSTAYLIAKKIIAPAGLYDKVANSKPYYNTNPKVSTLSDTNIYIPVTGEYTFRLKGKVTPGYDTTDKKGWYVNLVTGETRKYADNEKPSTAQYWYGVAQFNFLVDELYISTAATAGEYTVTFDSNGGTAVAEQKVKFGENAIRPENPTHATDSTLNFVDWYTDEELTTRFDFGSAIVADITLYAKWIGNQHTVTFNPNGGAINGNSNAVERTTDTSGNLAANQIPADSTVTRTGYTFMAWNTKDDGTGEDVTITIATVFDQDVEYFARWEINKYTVTFDINGWPFADAAPETQTGIRHGIDKVEDPNLTVPTNYHLTWYNGETVYDFNDAVTGNVNLVAKWYADNGIYFDNVLAKGLAKNEGNTDGTEYMALSVAQPKDDGAYLTMWYDGTERLSEIKSNNSPYRGEFVETGKVKLGKGVYAFYYKFNSNDNGLWIATENNQYIVNFMANGGAWTDGITEQTVVATGVVIPVANRPATPTREGFVFDGWYTAASGGTAVDLTTESFAANTALYAQWKELFTVTFNGNGGSWSDPTVVTTQTIVDGKYASTVVAPDIKPTVNSRFKYWGDVDGNKFEFATTPITESIELYAQWDEIDTTKVYITFNAGVGGVCDTETMTVDKDTAIGTLPQASKALHSFDGWFTAAEGGEQIFEDSTFSAGEITLYAQYTANKVRIELNVSGWPGANHDATYTYRLATSDTDVGVEMTWIGDNKFYVDLDSVVTDVIFKQYQKGTLTELSRYSTTLSTTLGQGTECDSATIDNVTIVGTNQIGLWFSNGIIVLDASALSNNPDKIYMWDSADVKLTGEWPGKVVTPGKFNEYELSGSKFEMSRVYGMILLNGNDKLTGDVIVNGAFVNGHIYTVGNTDVTEKVQYTVMLDANGGKWADGTTEQGQSIDPDGKVTKPADPTKSNNRFVGWYNGDTVWDFDNDTVSGNITLTAKWVELVTVTFFLNDGSGDVPAQTIDKGGKVTKPADPTKSNNRFAGWYNGDTAWDFDNYTVGGDITLTATWVEVVTVTFNLNGGSGDVPEKIIIDKGMNVTKPEHDPSKAGYSFVCWSATNSTSGGAEFDFGTAINENITLYAQWEENATPQFTVAFNLNGGSGSASEQIVNQGEKAKKPATDPIKSGYHFVCWSATNSMSGGAEFDFNNTAINENITLYAQWEKTLYKVTFVNKDGTVVGTLTADENDTLSGQNLLTATQPDGDWQWVGWRTGTAGAMSANGDLIDTDYTFTGDTYVWADWIELFTITFDVNTANGGSGSNTVYSGKKVGDTISIPANPSPSSDLYDFDGWYNKATGGTKYTTIPTVVGSSSVTYYAHYKAAKFRIVIDVSGWSGTTSYSYHIHAWKDGGDTVTGTGSDRWGTRNELERIAGTNQYYIDFDSSGTIITNIIITRDNTGTRTENARKTLTTSDFSSNGKFELGNVYTLETVEVVEEKDTAVSIGSSGVWLVGEGIQDGGWFNGVEIPNGGAVIVKVTNANGWLKIRNGGTGDGSGTNGFVDNGVLKADGSNFLVTKGAGYYKFTWDGSKVTAEFVRAA